MREYLVRTKRVGNEVIVTLPKELLQAEQIIPDMLVKITVQKCQKAAGSAEKDCSLGPEDPWRLLE
jgi:antitoxin component of MazEF toxin-antitoxin module